MDEEIKEPRAIVKEIKLASGVFSLRSPSTNRFSAAESYRENFEKGLFPDFFPENFLEASTNLYYAPLNREVISYGQVHEQIAKEKERLTIEYSPKTAEEQKKILVESAKNVLRSFGINSETMLIYTPALTKILAERDEKLKITVNFDREERSLLVKTVLLKNKEKSQEEIDAELKRAELEEIKKKYKFQSPKGESIRETLNKKTNPAEAVNTFSESLDSAKGRLTEFISACLSIPGKWADNLWTADFKAAGFLLPIQTIEIEAEKIFISSGAITNTEWWTKFTPIFQCPRFEGKLGIADDWEVFCQETRCKEACGADDGFVELSAARFRLIEESEIIRNDFRRLQEFIDRVYRLISDFNSTYGVEIHLDVTSTNPYLYAQVDREDEVNLRNCFEAFMTLYPEITDVRGKIDIEEFSLDENFDPVSEEGLVHEAKNYALQEMVRLAAKDMLNDLIREKDGEIAGNYYLIDRGRLRYVLKGNRIECIRDELYMGNLTFKKGINEAKGFFVTTLGGGRW